MVKRVISLVLAFVLGLMLIPAPQAQAARSEELQAQIEKQIRAFAKSINQSNADDKAAKTLATHGIYGRGKKLQVGQNHALTATLMNAEGTIDSLSYGLMRALTVMQHSNMQEIYAECGPNWNSANDIVSYVDLYSDAKMEEGSRILMSGVRTFSGTPNEYDKSLVWITGCAGTTVTIRREKVSKDSITYDVKIKFWDRFDFSISSGDGFKNLISGVGAVLFREFDWEATAGLKVTVPNTCTHGGKNYHWTYDASQMLFTPDDSEEYTVNGVLKVVETDRDTYHKLDEGVRLRHNIPWVMEYRIKNPNKFAYSLSEFKDSKHDYLLHYNVRFLFAARLAYDSAGNPYRQYYGTALNKYFNFNKTDIYTFRLENEVNPDGTNMIYVTVQNDTLGQTVMEKTPMDDYYVIENQSFVLKDKQSDGICGMDFDIWYVGNSSYRFTPDEFELWIWEDGVNPDEEMHFTKSVTKPTCTAKGYTSHTCELCGWSYTDSQTAKLGHTGGTATCKDKAVCTRCKESYGSTDAENHTGGTQLRNEKTVTCLEDGYTGDVHCLGCGEMTNPGEVVTATGHNYENGICTACGHREWIPGDVDLDGDVDVDDVLALLWYVLFPDDYPIEMDADFDHNGSTDVDDVLTLLWYVLFPEDYPLKGM